MAKHITISEDHLDILHYIQNDSVLSQRQMSQKTGLSVGKVNYILKSLLDIGFIKINYFNKSSKKINYLYVLTPQGIKEKTNLTKQFIIKKKLEYDKLKSYLT